VRGIDTCEAAGGLSAVGRAWRASGVGVPTVHASAGPCNASVNEKFV